MKQLIVLRGIPGSGKSTFVKDFGLEPYVISTDSLRMLFKNLNLGEDGQLSIDQSVSKEVFGYIDELLDKKMRRGEYIIIDATHTSTQSIQRYIPLSQKYGYKVFVVDFTDVSLAACIERNKKRESYKFVPEEVIKRMHEQLITSELPREVTLTTPAQFLEATKFSATDLSHYQTIHHIGDIQGVYAPLKEYFDTYPYSESDYYIFTGDLVDRGNENDEVVRFVLELLKKDNVVLIEGNHDTHLYNWSVGRTVKSDEFNLRTAPQLEQSNIHRKEVSSILRKKMISCLLYTYGDKKVLVTHGGLSALPERLERISDATIIRGSGSYESVDTVGDQFCKRTDSDTYAIHGHRNMQILPTQSHERVFNLEGKVEFGGDLRVVQLTSQGFEIVEIPAELKAIATSTFPENTEFLEYLRSHKHINERVLLGNISSFNFSRELFQSKNWNDQTIKARGLFLNITTQEIIIRSYNKFFNINEMPESSLKTIEVEWQFPVTVWRKENGFLGLIGYDSSTDNLIFSSKSSTESEHRYWFERIITKTLDDEKLAKLKTYLKHNNAAMVCECIDPYNDPHIIDEDKKRVVLLDVVRRTQEFSRIDQDKQIALAEELGLTYKVKSTVLNSYQELLNWYNSVSSVDYNEDGKYYEGYVLEDPTGRMTKIKCEYYSFWKRMRPIITNHKTLVNTTNYNKFSRPELAESFLEFVRLIKPHLEHNIDVITMRRLYYTLRK
jgi:predicted kinase/UDP-2,3-diacylglucosamine pyrophosphatase LpxH